ncbi:BolA family transcriptional regulator [Rickettsiales bacterium]|nr:BolA family transcriptional regulator [Rickettsiales bacterium]
MKISESIRIKLEKELSPSLLSIKDETNEHIGHHHISPGAEETHIKIIIKSPKFADLKLIEIHRMIYKILEEEMRQIHALSIETK